MLTTLVTISYSHNTQWDIWFVAWLFHWFRSYHIITACGRWHRLNQDHFSRCSTDQVLTFYSARYNQGNARNSTQWGQSDDPWETCLMRYRLLSASETEMKHRKWRKHKREKNCVAIAKCSLLAPWHHWALRIRK